MTPERAAIVLAATTMTPEGETAEDRLPSHLVTRSGHRVCDGRETVGWVLADSEVPTCRRCAHAGAAAQRLAEASP